MAWVPLDDQYVPFVNASRAMNATKNSTAAISLPPSMLGQHLSYDRPVTLMVAVMPNMFLASVEMPTHIIPAGCAYGPTYGSIGFTGFSDAVLSDSTFLQCQVFNTSQSAFFEYSNGQQRVIVDSSPTPNDEALLPIEHMRGPMNPTNGGPDPEIAIAEAANKSCSTLNLSDKECEFDPEVLRILSYQAIVDAFNRLVQGTIGLDTSALAPALNPETNLLNTVLQNSKELEFLEGIDVLPDSTIPSLPSLFEASNGSEYQGLYVNATASRQLPLAKALEQLFQNITLSLLSEKYLQYVTLPLHHNIPS